MGHIDEELYRREWAELEHQDADDPVVELRGEVARLKRAIGRAIHAHYLDDNLPRDVFDERIRGYKDRLEVYEAKLATVDTSARLRALPDIQSVRELWPRMTVAHRRGVLACFVQQATVTKATGSRRAAGNRVRVRPR